MAFNEILIPQDFFTETNVTRKRSVVGNSQLSQKIFILLLFFVNILFHIFQDYSIKIFFKKNKVMIKSNPC